MDSKLPIRHLDYAVIFARQMPEMCDFYEKTLGFEFHRTLGPKWVEFRRPAWSQVLARRSEHR